MTRRLRDLSLSQLIGEYDRLQESINENDGRLTSGSSAQLDMEMEAQETVAFELIERLGVNRWVIPLIQEEMRKYRVGQKRGMLVSALIHVGFVSIDHNGDIHWPFRVAPAHMWRYLFWHEPWFGAFRNLPGVVKWLNGRFLPRRWGCRFIGLEFGDRGSSEAKQDMRRDGLFQWKDGSK